MSPKLLSRATVIAALLLAATCTTLAPAATYQFFDIVADNPVNGAIGEAQLSMVVTDPGAGQVLFTFANAGPEPCSITDVYFDDADEGVLAALANISNTPGSVEFSQYASPSNLPEGETLNPEFITTDGFSADSDSPPPVKGVNPGESLGITFQLAGGMTFQDVIIALNGALLRAGIHVQAFASGGSESFVNIACPGPDTDGDGVPDACDNCPDDPDKTEPGECGCGVPDTPDCNDECPDDPDKAEPGECGCGVPDTDTDGDGTPDCNDDCPDDPDKAEPGDCGCGVPDTDTDGDGTPDCNDNCPDDPDKTEPGECGCGVPDSPDCNDECPDDPDKTEPGECGCGVPDTDTDQDGIPDCHDICPGFDDNADQDGDGVPDGCDICEGFPDDVDTDGDGVPDDCDACPGFDDNADEDEDGIPDGCDLCERFPDDIDTDGDKVPDGCDICEGFDDNEDTDGDGIPDGCDDEPPGPQPIPCPDCPTPDEMLAVGWFCPSAAGTMFTLLMVGVVVTSGRRRGV